MSNRERGDRFAEQVGKYLSQLGILVKSEYSVSVGLNSQNRKAHRFDFGNNDLLVECKFYDWTEGGNNPSAKVSTLNEAMMYFHSTPTTYRKMLFVPETSKKGVRKPETFAEYYVRLHCHFIPEAVEVWELNTDTLKARKIPIPIAT
jgi:hypothetical protein